MFLGKLKRSEEIPITLTLDAAPTGTPQFSILNSDHSENVAAANLTQGDSTLEWYKAGQTVGAAEAVGSYLVKYIAVIDGVTRYAYDSFEVTINEIDDVSTALAVVDTNVDAILEDTSTTLPAEHAALPTATEIDTELTAAHGAGAWTAGAGSGARSIIFNIKDGDTNNVEGCKISVHNSSNDDSPIYGQSVTDTDGNSQTINLDDATYKVRLSKAGAIVSEVETVVITQSETVNLTVVNQTVSNPSDPDVCRLRIYPITLGNADITDLADNLIISSRDALYKVEDQFIRNTTATFTYDSGTTPDSYYFDAVRTSIVHLKCDILGIDHDFTVPDLATKDLTDLVS